MMLHALLATSLLALCACTDRDPVMDLANSNTAFGFNLLNTIQDKEGGNVFLSPFSISTALAMTFLGASGKTRDQLATGLQIKGYEEPVQLFDHLNERLFQQQAPDGYILRQANRLYGDKDTTFKHDFLTDIRRSFGAPLSKVDFSLDSTREDINLWVEEETEQKIKDLLSEGDLQNAILVLINAIYFKALWLEPFDAQSTRKEDFAITSTRSVEVEMMTHVVSRKFNVGELPGLNARILEMKYKGETASMFIILPDESSDLCAVQEGLTMDTLKEAIDNMKNTYIRLKVPKFELKDRILLKTYLSNLNMTDMFDPSRADFSKISDVNLAVSEVIHQSFVRVDENGTEAAAATAVIIGRSSMPQVPWFTVNKPFLFFIRDSASHSVLFLGRVVDPTDAAVTESGENYRCLPKTILYTAQKRVAPVVNLDGGAGVATLSVCVAILTAIFVAFMSK